MTEGSKHSLTNSWLSDKLEIRTDASIEGRGMFALQPIQRGERVAVWGGDVVPRAFFSCDSRP